MFSPPFSPTATRVMLLGSGELGKEVILEAQRYGVETIAVDRYPNAPAMQVAHHHHVVDMTDADALRTLILSEKPDLIVPEIEAISTDTLVALEREGFRVIPTATAAKLTMDRKGIRTLVAEELGIPTARYAFATSLAAFKKAAYEIGFPCVVKPIMSSSGKGQSICRSEKEMEQVWNYAMTAGRVKSAEVIVESFIPFESEITLLAVRTASGTLFCPPIGHRQQDGDYIESWQPHAMNPQHLEKAQEIAKRVTDRLGGYGVFGVELFLTPDEVYFSEVSPRPHDTGMVTMITQNLSEFALHVRAILGFPIPEIQLLSPGASHVLKADADAPSYRIEGVADVLAYPQTQVRLFGKPTITKGRRIAVVLSSDPDVTKARQTAKAAASCLRTVAE
ncbi:formate-dependent phosphoribosylglycinamide formyltransferase [Ferroacidibacillus organovorans]|uniref:Formate-dependent phosphoribosylglycinamide formyltransferase n=1 Tax=Ferroacidibacillus organovorans TaxID=1765683 RepID=A0A1V4EVB2_9BACL|nr:formate-dependent phosphoribosylglycinamide formyltransferase [Ferroacidibacillus organovorans]OPG16887.1 phosphoribosylglycinamide formyltransferase 2 [Ferroacidibacillus organovorans]